nr:nucleotidyltransferase family protein [uncultured Mucilaginibacter sp.]
MTGIIILAAGESKRLGQPKQNMLFRGKTLLQHAIDAALNSGCCPVIVVLGGNADQISIASHPEITVLQNHNWQEGMASSIRLAVDELIKHQADNAIIMLCDQPFIDACLISSLLQTKQHTGKPIVACHYNDALGVPVLFDKALFAQLRLLTGHEGAKKILATHQAEIALVEFEKGGVDIDTMGDYEGLIVGQV